jgi:hypothetical protein
MRTDVPIYVLAGILLSGIAYYALRAWHRSRVPCRDVAGSVTALASPDLNQEDVSAADLPWEGWLTLVEDLMRQGRYRLALRACFLAQLAQLADLGHIVLARYKTNRDYEGELARRHHVLPRHYDRFHHNRRLFEAVWYGNREVGPEHIVEFRAHMSTAAGGSA